MDQANGDMQRRRRLERYALQAGAAELLPERERLGKCMRVSRGGEVHVVYSESRKSASYRQLTTCGSVWCCPVCAAKVSERRRAELARAVAKWKKTGGEVWLLTLTFPHKAHHSLSPMLKKLKHAVKQFWGGRAAEDFKARWGLVGHVRALEVTHGKNGWHPHFHVLLFVNPGDSSATREALQERMYLKWRSACLQADLPEPSEKHGVRVDDGSKAARYVSKWGLESELTRQATKVAKSSDSRTPMALLADYVVERDDLAGELWREYAKVFGGEGRGKGERQLVWSRGLRDLLQLGEELTDEEVAEQDEVQDEQLLVVIPLRVWHLVVNADARGLVLAVASRGNELEVWRYLKSLPGFDELGLEESGWSLAG